MDRRAFFKGAFGGVTAAGIVLAGSPRDIESFSEIVAPGSPIVVGPEMPTMAAGLGIGEPLFNSRGQMVGVLDEVRHMPGQALDVSVIGDRTRSYIKGIGVTIGRVIISGQVRLVP